VGRRTVVATLLYNLIVAYADAVFLFPVARHRTLARGLLAAVDVAAVALFAAALAGDPFGVVRLATHGIFFHEVVVLAVTAWLLRRAIPIAAWSAAALALVLVAVGIDAFVVEPHWLEVTHVELASAKLARPVRVVVVADLQCDTLGDYEKRALRTALDEKPDVILLAGDYTQVRQQAAAERLHEQISDYLREIGFSAPLGVFAVRGNVDSDLWARSFAGLPVTTVDATRSFDLGPLVLTCLSLADSRRVDLELARPQAGKCHMVLGHVPDFALGRCDADLLVAGHTHGGQVRLPLVGAMMTGSRVPRSWVAGMTQLPGGGHLLVSRGVGMERGHAPRLRFCCRPELVVVDLVCPGEGT
jgi:uncharacterized protein